MADDGYDIYGGAPAGGGGLAGMVAGLPTGGGYDDMGGGGGGGGYDEGQAPAAPPSLAKKVSSGLRQGLMDAMNAESAGKANFRKVVEEVAPCFDSGPLLVMEEILEKLKMLDYEDHFKSFRPLTHTYFAMASANPNEQFYYFTSLVSWLLSLLGQSWKAPSQLDDPNSAVASMYAMLQQIGAPTNFGAMKLKNGCGEAVCSVLKHLLDLIPIEFHLPVYAEENAYEEAAVDEDAEVEAEEMADEVGAADVEEDEMYYHGGDAAGQVGERDKLTDSILDASVAPEAWRLELERVTPQLKMQVLSDPKEWRNRLVNTKSHHAKVAELTPETHATVERLADDLERTLAAVRKAEQKLSQQLQGEVAEFSEKQEEMKAKQEEYAQNSEQINALTNELAAVSDELETVKARMDERGNSMTDTSPLIKIKSALTQLRSEAKQMEIRIGIVNHTLVAKKLKSDSATRAEASVPKNKHIDHETFMDDDLEDY